MDIFEELDKEQNFYLTKNMSTRGICKNEKISIEDIDYYSKKVRINSPRSLLAMNQLGINQNDLKYMTFKEYLLKYPELIPKEREIQKIKFHYSEEIRIRKIEEIKELRNRIIEKEINQPKKRCFSSKVRDQRLSNSFLEKDIKSFYRMRNINKTELFNKMQIELKKELMRIINEEKEKEEKHKLREGQKKLNRRMKMQKLKR